MERKNPQLSGSNKDSWGTSQNSGGTPKAQNSVFQSKPTPTPILTATLTPLPTPTPTSTPSPTLTSTPSPTSSTSSPAPTPRPIYSRQIVINEFLPDPIGDDSQNEWIELFNEGNEPVDLAGWQLTDKTSKFTILQNTIIGAKSFLIFPRPVTKLSINNDGETLSLFDPNGDLVFRISYEDKAPEGQSLNRQPDGQWFWSNLPTSGQGNVIKTPTPKPSPTSTSTIQPIKSVSPISPSPAAAEKTSLPIPATNEPSPIAESQPDRVNQGREEIVRITPVQKFVSNPSSAVSEERSNSVSKEDENIGANRQSPAGQNFSASISVWQNYKLVGLAALIGSLSLIGILLLKRFLI
jgi:hypothetical protein